jgi:hypothetical protein
MGLRGPGADPLSARPWWPKPAPKPHVTHTLTCWECRCRFKARRIDATFCSERCKKRVQRRRKAAIEFKCVTSAPRS